MADSTQYFTDVLKLLGAAQPSPQSVGFLNAWGGREGVPQTIDPYNLLGTTLPMNGSHGTNGPGVQAYPNYSSGVHATAAMLNQSNFSALKNALLSGNPNSFRGDPNVQREFKLWSGGGYDWPTSGGGSLSLPSGGGGTQTNVSRPVSGTPAAGAPVQPKADNFLNLITSIIGSGGNYSDPGLAFKPYPDAPGGAGIVQIPKTPPDNSLSLLRALLSSQKAPAAKPAQPLAARPEPAVGNQPAEVGPSRGPLHLAEVPSGIATHPVEINRVIMPAVMQIARDFGVKVESGFRSAEHNAAVGGAPGSDHLKGNAVDFVGSPEAMINLYHWAQGRFPYVEPWSQTHGNHVHVSFIR